MKKALAAALVLQLGLVFAAFAPCFPLGVPGKWVWNKTAAYFPDPLGILLIALGIALAFFAVMRLKRGALPLLLAAGIFLDGGILLSGRLGATENAWAFLDRFATGYMDTVLRHEGNLVEHCKTELHLLMAGEVPNHRHVHPPGNVFFTALVVQCAPDFGARVFQTAAADLAQLAKEGMLAIPQDTPAARKGALNLLLLGILGLCAGRFFLLLLLRRFPMRNRATAELCVVLGTANAALFLGHYDAFYFALTAMAVFFFIPTSLWALFLCGALLCLGSSMSLGFGGAIVLALGLLVLRRDRLRAVAALGAGALVVLLAYAAVGIPLLLTMLRAWENHRIFQSMAGMAYWPWCFWNTVDALLFAGVVPALALLFAPKLRGKLRVPLCGIGLMWLFLLFSGSARGEFGRLLLLYLPLLLFGAACVLGRLRLPSKLVYAVLLGGALQTVLLRFALKVVLID